MAPEAGRGVTLLHQHVALELSFAGYVEGHTELTLVPTDTGVKTVHIHLRHARIVRVAVNGQPAAYAYNDLASSPPSIGNPPDVHRYPELKRHIYAAASDAALGELSIRLPDALDLGSTDAEPTEELPPLRVRIDYVLDQPYQGLRIVRPEPDAPTRWPQIFTTPNCPDWARCWVPCVDSLWARCTWRLDFVVPRYLPLNLPEDGSEGEEVDGLDDAQLTELDAEEEAEDGEPVTVVCTGTLVEKVAHPHSPSKVLWSFEHAVPTTVQHVSFAVGPFEAHSFVPPPRQAQPEKDVPAPTTTTTTTTTATTMTTASAAPVTTNGTAPVANGTAPAPAPAPVPAPVTEPPVIGYALPGQRDMMINSIGFARTALDFFARDYGSYPFDSFSIVFVDEPPVDCHIASTLAICSSDLLHPTNIVDQAYETHQIIAHAIAWQWIGINLIQRSWADTWLIHGVNLHMAGMFLRRVWGNNEYRFRLRKDVDRLTSMDVAMPPLFQPGLTEPPDSTFLSFINLKAPLVLHILDRKLAKLGSSFGLNRALNRIFMEALTGSLDNNVLSTSHFLRLCRKLQGVDLSTFTDQWIHGSGCPRFNVTATFNRKKFIIEMHIRQESPSYAFAQTNPTDAIYSNPVQRFEGQMTVRIHEADGTPYEHVIEIDATDKRIDVPFNTKYKRVRRNTKRFQARKEAAAAAAAGDEDAREAMGLMDLGFIYGQWEDEQARDEWRVADWTEQEEVDMNNAPYEWIRLDAEFEWLADFAFQQEPWMWASQLERDRDIVAQLDAVKALAGMPSTVVSSLLTRTVLVDRYFFRVRTEAAQALVNCAIEPLDFIGLFHLYKLFQTRYCYPQPPEYVPEHSLDLLLVPRANDFTDFADYFLRRTMLHAISRVRDQNGRPFDHVRRFLANALRYNDNSTNKISDDYYVAGLINSIALAFLPAEHNLIAAPPPPTEADVLLLQAAVNEVESCRELDMLVPSYHNVVSIASLDFHLASMLASLRPVDLQLFFVYTRPGNFVPLRLAAFNCLLMLGGLQHKVIARYTFTILRTDESEVIKRALAQLIVESLAVAIAANVHAELKPRRSIYVESESDVLSATREADKARQSNLSQVLRTVRREVGRSASIRQGYLAALLDPKADVAARWALLKLGELLFKPAAETALPSMPKVPVNHREGVPRLTLRINQGDGSTLAEPTAPVAPSARGVAFDPKRRERSLPKLTLRANKPKRAKPVPKEQLSGMGPMDVTVSRNCLRNLYASQHAWLFKNPVDPVRDNAPNYLAVISEPMDLSTIENKLNSGLYKDRFAFKADFDLMVRNAKTYTPDPRAFVHIEADKLGKEFDRHWTRITRTIQAAEEKHKAQAAKAVLAPSDDNMDEEEDEPLAQTTVRPPPQGQPPSRDAHASDVKDEDEGEGEDEDEDDAPLALSVPPAPPAAQPTPPKSKPVKLKFKSRSSAPSGISTPMPAPPAPTAPVSRLSGTSESGVPSAPSAAPPAPKLKMKLGKPRLSAPNPPPVPPSTSPEKSTAPAAPARPASGSPAPKPSAPKVIPKAAPRLSPKPSAPPASAVGSPSSSAAGPSHGESSTSKPKQARPTELRPELALSDPVGAAGKAQFHLKRGKQLIQTLKKMPEAIFFLRPVDPILDGAPTYLEEIKHPMDLGTMEKKITLGSYSHMSEFASDAMLIFANARQFNPPRTVPYLYADAVEAAFLQEWSKALVPSLEYAEKRALQGLLSRLKNNVIVSGLFLTAVDPIALGIPNYFDVIPKQNARDLSLIESKLKSDQYKSVKAFTDDINLMVHNARTFNALDPTVLALVDTFEKQYRKELATARQSISHALGLGDAAGAKRKSAGGSTAGSASKKARH